MELPTLCSMLSNLAMLGMLRAWHTDAHRHAPEPDIQSDASAIAKHRPIHMRASPTIVSANGLRAWRFSLEVSRRELTNVVRAHI